MDFISLLLLIGLAFAGLVLLLLFITFIWKECLKTNTPSSVPEYIPVRLGDFNQGSASIANINCTSSGNLYSVLPAASAPVFADINWNEQTTTRRTRRNTAISIDTAPISQEELRAIQAGLLRELTSPAPVEKSDDSKLIIGVFANSTHFCGYCINLQGNWVEFYRINTEHLPWKLLDEPDDGSEYEMRNFFFALMLWSKVIEEAKKFSIYTGSRAANHDNNRLWRKATKLLEHFQGCQRIVVENDLRFYVNPRKNAKAFAVKIVPAEDLSENIVDFISFVSQYYGIPTTEFRGSHHIPAQSDEGTGQTDDITEKYQLYINQVRNARMEWAEACPKCGYIDADAAILTCTGPDCD